jgi:hypothetical protein
MRDTAAPVVQAPRRLARTRAVPMPKPAVAIRYVKAFRDAGLPVDRTEIVERTESAPAKIVLFHDAKIAPEQPGRSPPVAPQKDWRL